MRKLSVEEEVKRDLIHAKYQYPAYCSTYDKEGNIKSSADGTHMGTALFRQAAEQLLDYYTLNLGLKLIDIYLRCFMGNFNNFLKMHTI